MKKRPPPLCVDLFCGLGGWTDGFLAEGFEVIGFDTERHVYGAHRYPAQLVLQDVRTIHGRQFKDASIIVASSPCQKYSYMAMPLGKNELGRKHGSKSKARKAASAQIAKIPFPLARWIAQVTRAAAEIAA